MDSVKRILRQTEPARNAIAALRLTPELVRDAGILVSFYDRVDWRQLDQAQCGSVQLQFQSSEAVQTANRILLEMAAGDPKIRDDLIRKIKTAFQQSGSPLDPDNIGAENSSRHSVDKTLAAIITASSPSKFAEQCIRAAHLYSEMSPGCLQYTSAQSETWTKDTATTYGPTANGVRHCLLAWAG